MKNSKKTKTDSKIKKTKTKHNLENSENFFDVIKELIQCTFKVKKYDEYAYNSLATTIDLIMSKDSMYVEHVNSSDLLVNTINKTPLVIDKETMDEIDIIVNDVIENLKTDKDI